MEVRLTARVRDMVVATRSVRVRHRNLELFDGPADDGLVRMSGGLLIVEGRDGRVEEHGMRARDVVRVPDGGAALAGETLYLRHPYADMIVAPVPEGEEAEVRFRDLAPWVSFEERVDELTGLTVLTVTRAPPYMRPALELAPRSPGAAWRAERVPLPPGAELQCRDGDVVTRGALLARVGGLPTWRSPEGSTEWLLLDHLEGRSAHPRKAVVAPVSGRARVGGDVPEGAVVLVAGGVEHVVRLPSRPHSLYVFDGMWVHRGDAMTDGVIDHRDLARALGREGFAAHLGGELRELFGMGGVALGGAQAELVARALADRVEVTDPGDSRYLAGEVASRDDVLDANDRLRAEGRRPARYETVFTGLSSPSRRR